MDSKLFKYIFFSLIIILILAGIYIIYIKDNENKKGSGVMGKETEISKEISIGITDFDTVNPILTKNLEISHILKLVYLPLINISEDFRAVPGIAEEWSRIDDLTYIVNLDDTKRWDNGDKITVEDIVFTINTIKTTDSIYKENVQKIDKVEKIDEDTLKIYLVEPIDFFEYYLCFPIVQEISYNNEILQASGFYRISKKDDKEIILESEKIKVIIKIYKNATELYNSFAREDVDIIITQNTDYEKYIGNIGFEESIVTGREFYYISCENIKDINTRKYLNSIINKERLIYELYNNKYVLVDFPLEYGSYLNKKKVQESEAVNQIKQKAFNLSTTTENKEVAKHIEKILEEKGLRVNVQNYNNTKADLILKKETVLIMPNISQYFKDENIKNRLDKIIRIEDSAILKQEYANIINEYYEEMPFISLYFNSYIILHNKKIKGDFSGNWYNLFYNVDTWYKEK